MRHATEGVLRRLSDEPAAVPDLVREHVAGCPRCQGRRQHIGQDAERCARLLAGPQLAPDADVAWARMQQDLDRPEAQGAGRRRGSTASPRRSYRFRRMSLRTGLVAAATAVVLAGTAAAATLTTVFAPVRVAPITLSSSDLKAVAAFMGLGDGHVLGGFARPSGSRTLPFGTIRWSSAAPASRVKSLAQATAAAGFPVKLPARLPSGVGAPEGFFVQPRVRATVTFNSGEAGVGGSSVTISAGPAVLTEYGSANGANIPTLAVAAMRRPTAVSTGATMDQIEGFLLRQPGIPQDLAEEIRLLGNLGTTLPVPVPPGSSVRSVQVSGWPGVLVTDSSKAVAGVAWEDGRGVLHLVVGLLDAQDVLHVAKQLG